MLQEDPGATVVQLPVWRNCLGLVPVIETDLIVRSPVPLLETVTVLETGALTLTVPKSKEAGETEMEGTVGAAFWVTVQAFPRMVIVPVRGEVMPFTVTA
jgi:hypothetical protein